MTSHECAAKSYQNERCGFRHGRLTRAGEELAGAAAGHGAAEVGAPLIVLRRADGTADRVVGQWIGRALAVAPDGVIGGVDGAVLVVVARESGGENPLEAGAPPAAGGAL